LADPGPWPSRRSARRPRLRPSSRPLPEGFRRWRRRIISSWQDWTGADLGELAKGQLAPFCLEGQERLSIEGPKVTLSPPQAIALGVVLHELGTNAARYGALSNGIGRVNLSWTLGPGRVVLAWAERQGPLVVPPQRKGLGTKLIQRGLPDATIDWRFEAEGVVCAIDLPLAKLQPKNGSATRVNL
jgi:two-component system, chemotaxis family, CheB/CheR fusion protein